MKFKFLIIFVLILIGIFVFLYFYYEEPKQVKENTFTNLSIIINYNDKIIKTGYKIELNNFTYKLNETIDNYPILVQINSNNSIKVQNYNLENQNFYTAYKFYNLESDIVRASLDLEKPEELNYSYQISGNEINLTIFSEDFRNMISCLKYSSRVIYADLGYELLENPERYKNKAKCYDLNLSLLNNSENILIDFKTMGELKQDWINITLIDRDFDGNEYILGNETDQFGGDKEIEILLINNK
jgi:hypothetical protein